MIDRSAAMPGRRAPIRPSNPAVRAPPTVADQIASAAVGGPSSGFPDRVVYVAAQARANHIHEFELTAKLVDNAKAKPFKPRQYLWDFGDGDSEVTAGGYTIH